MPHFNLKVDGLLTGYSTNTYKTVLGIKFANTTGHRAKLRKLVIGGGGGAAQDVQVSLRLRRTNNATDGTSESVNVNTIAKADAGSLASNAAAIGKNYSAEPTAFETGALGIGSVNSRGTLVMEWGPEEAPVWGPNQTLGIEAASGATVTTTLEVHAEWQEF